MPPCRGQWYPGVARFLAAPAPLRLIQFGRAVWFDKAPPMAGLLF
ncbi:protein of unknown function [Cupriavidus neocaledonicus]|uniref:Uncharacterized protein n=1 Tax=Cupriavidus neocaledonicus TaxID=1040979 RepID=A0A375HC25_9BURK|nr:hypothetical protein CBM2605_A230157 [Cupriavidus neocaledonicus]SPD47869.1 protein of unknown function [Cupriavidus neocaledonicus]